MLLNANLEFQVENTIQAKKVMQALEIIGIKPNLKITKTGKTNSNSKAKKSKKDKKYTIKEMSENIQKYWQKHPEKKTNLQITQKEIDDLSSY